ncbi:PIN domain-containing protein [Candidatus Pacearchaeota archaeon]|nr:PIN domain-containing protein [Candidatus Pacearchaeota archaeon]
MAVSYFFDTYSIIELIEGNQRYAKYEDESATITIFNLAEIYWVVLNKLGEKQADEVFKEYKDAVAEIDDDTLKEAIKFRKENKKQDFSYADCIGYIYAKRHGMKFLTGDKEFEELPIVEFVE